MADEKRFYWLKLDADFFDSHEAKIIAGSDPDKSRGQLMLLFYIKLLVESVSHDGMLRFSDLVPYTTEMLASLTHTTPEFAREAVEMLEGLGLLEYLMDGTIWLPAVEEMTGSRSQTEEAVRQRRLRERRKLQEQQERDKSVTGVTDI